MTQGNTQFSGPVPDIYDRFMVPLLFQTYAEDMAARVAALRPAAVLETAAGSGVVSRILAPLLPQAARYVVSDLNPPMLERAKARQSPDDRIEWAVADALNPPFPDASFDAVCCQFGAMFFPDKVRGYAEALRVLRPGAPFLFNVWDSLAENEVTDVLWQAVLDFYAEDRPDFFTRGPHGYFDRARIRADLEAAGFGDIGIETVTRQSHAPSARDVAVALCTGTPFRMWIAERHPDTLEAVTAAAEAAVRARYGDGPVISKIQAVVVTARA